MREEIFAKVRQIYQYIEDWIRPDPEQPTWKQVLMFILKLPALVILLLLSPVFLVLLLVLFIIAL